MNFVTEKIDVGKIVPRPTSSVHPLRIIDCGLADYRQILQLQLDLHEKRLTGQIPNTVLVVEHPPVITLGARHSANKLQISRDELTKRHIDVVDIRRGGGTTAHNPDQLVFYPILDLRRLDLDISEYIRKLEEIGIELLEQLGVNAERCRGLPGLWVMDEKRATKKIASIGVRVSKFVTYHGMAINIQNDLSIFDYIVPCGLDGIEMTSVLKERGAQYPMELVKKKLSQILMKHFSHQHHTMSSKRTTQYERQATNDKQRKLPSWLRRPLPASENFHRTEQVLTSLGLQTICYSANCPNRWQCWEKGTATVLILGNICTRNCKFCSVSAGRPAPPDPTEPARLAEMAKKLNLKYLVITSVNRDDLPDGGASHFRNCISEVRRQLPNIKFEILTPDFRNCQTQAIKILKDALPFVFAHNVETVPSLYSIVRAGGNYQRSLNLLKLAKENFVPFKPNAFLRKQESGLTGFDGIHTKSSIMLGLGETDTEVEQVLKDLLNVGCDRITIGQYLKPSKNSLDVVDYIPPAKFDFWKNKAIEFGFSWVISSPFARSSYFAEKQNAL